MDIAYLIGAIVGAIIMGGIVGAIPLILGLRRERKNLAIMGFISCIVGSLILDLFLSVPLCIIFVLLILFTKGNKPETDTNADAS